MQDNTEFTRAGFGPRFAAFIIDRFLLFLALAFIRIPAAIASIFGGSGFALRAFLFRYTALDVLCWVLSCIYFILLTYFTGSTLGKKVMRLRVESADGTPLTLLNVIYRETVGRFLSSIMYLGYLMILADREKRAFHDWLCGTSVIYEGVVFKPRAPKHPAEYSVPGSGSAELRTAAPAQGGYSVPGSPTAYSVPGSRTDYSVPGSPSGYSIPGSSAPAPAEESLPAGEPAPIEDPLPAEQSLSPELPFPAEEPTDP